NDLLKVIRSMSANSSLSMRIPYAPTIPAEFATHAALRCGQILRPISLRRLDRTLELLVWKQSWPNRHHKPFAKKSGGVMARLLAEKHLLVATGAALLQVPIRYATQPKSQRWHR